MEQQQISVIGAGTMGNGIAHVFAQQGFKVSIVDVNKAQLEKAIQTITKKFVCESVSIQIHNDIES